MVVVRYRALASVVAFVMTVAVAFIPRAALADESVPPAPAAAPDLAIEAKRRGDDAQRSSLLGTTLLVSGGILGGAAISTWLLWPGTKATRLAPTAAKDAAGVVMTGTF